MSSKNSAKFLKTASKGLIGLCLLLAIWGLCRLSHFATAGFRMSKIQNNFPNKVLLPNADIPLLEDSKIFSQKYTYLGRGLQSFSFQSQDGQYVLKIFNNQLNHQIFFSKLFFFLPKQAQKKAKAKKTLLKTFLSYQLAFEELKEETGLLYLHISPTHNIYRNNLKNRNFDKEAPQNACPERAAIAGRQDASEGKRFEVKPLLSKTDSSGCFGIKQQVALVDRLGIEHVINLDDVGFALQKKATLAYPALLQFKQEQNDEGAKRALSGMLKLILSRCQKGIGDDDPLIRTNFGFIGEKPILIDIGPFFWDPASKDSKNYYPEIIRITTSLKIWLNENYPVLTPYLEKELAQLLN